MRTRSNTIFIGVGSHVVALDTRDGGELWRTKLKAASFVTVMPAGNRVFAGATGVAFCLDAATGEILWKNKLEGLGLGIVSFGPTDEALMSAAQAAQQAAAG